jgi:hypothetical protein
LPIELARLFPKPICVASFPTSQQSISIPHFSRFPWLIDHDQWERGTKVHYFIPSHPIHCIPSISLLFNPAVHPIPMLSTPSSANFLIHHRL